MSMMGYECSRCGELHSQEYFLCHTCLRAQLKDAEGKLQRAEMQIEREEVWHHKEIDNLREQNQRYREALEDYAYTEVWDDGRIARQALEDT